MREERFDIHQHITNQIITMLDRSRGGFHLPWRQPGASAMRPVNVASEAAYRGVNIVALWASAEEKGYASGLWGTYRQWASLGARVRKGAKASYVVFYRDGGTEKHAESPEEAEDGAAPARKLMARASAVFAAEQVDNFIAPERTSPDPVVANESAERLVIATGATIHHEGCRAFYRPSTDSIHIPRREAFIGTATSSQPRPITRRSSTS